MTDHDTHAPSGSCGGAPFALESDEREFAELHALLTGASIPVRDGFVAQLMGSLPEAAGEEQVAGLLARDRISVHDGFADRVMADLPDAPWADRRQIPWAAAAGIALLLALGATLFLGRSSETSLLTGVMASIGDLIAVGLAAGAGFLAASWGGLRVAAGDAMQGSPVLLAAVAGLVIALGAVLYRLLRGRRTAKAIVAPRD